jgi:hypothetical protein
MHAISSVAEKFLGPQKGYAQWSYAILWDRPEDGLCEQAKTWLSNSVHM